ncbi:MAG: Required for respiratory growth protein 9 mitochondrial [Watsoniomyces obsoletus]|nr:MAG: Required for respiratory growth protein 9 mitochondrial [Watsoniomyces obsoletus]
MSGAMFLQGMQGSPVGMPTEGPPPTESAAVNRLHELYMARNQAVMERLEAESRGYPSPFSG